MTNNIHEFSQKPLWMHYNRLLMSSYHIIDVVFIEKVTTSSNMNPVSRNQPDTDDTTVSYSSLWPWLTAYICSALTKHFAWQSGHWVAPHSILPTHGENKLRTKWPQRITQCSIPSRGLTFLSSAEKREEEGKKHSITQRLGKQAGELLGRRDCHVCINRHWFFCPVLAPQPFILSLVVGAQRGCRNSVTVQLGPWGLCVRIDFTCKRGGGLKPLNKGRLCHQRAGWVKSHWMDNDTYFEKRGRMRDRKMEGEERETSESVEERQKRCSRYTKKFVTTA